MKLRIIARCAISGKFCVSRRYSHLRRSYCRQIELHGNDDDGQRDVVHTVIFVYPFRACKVRHRTRLGTRERTGKRPVRSRKIQFHAITGRTVSCRPSFSKTEAPLDELLWIALSVGGKRRRRDALFPHRVAYCAILRYRRGPSTVPATTATFVYVLLPLFRRPAKSKRHCSA